MRRREFIGLLGGAARHTPPEGGVDTRDHDSRHVSELATTRAVKHQRGRFPRVSEAVGAATGRGWHGRPRR